MQAQLANNMPAAPPPPQGFPQPQPFPNQGHPFLPHPQQVTPQHMALMQQHFNQHWNQQLLQMQQQVNANQQQLGIANPLPNGVANPVGNMAVNANNWNVGTQAKFPLDRWTPRGIMAGTAQ